MRRVFPIFLAGTALSALLAGCSSFSLGSLSSPPTVEVQLNSTPPGADATTSVGPGCKTPCTVAVVAPDGGFTVTFAAPKYQPVTVEVQVIRNPGGAGEAAFTALDPNPVMAQLQPAAPPPKAKPMRPKKKPKPASTAPAAAPAAASPFPNPTAAPPAR